MFRKSSGLLDMAALAILVLTCQPTFAENYVLEKVVQVSRHGVRPPTAGNTKAMEAATARKWPVWFTRDGELTGHGYAASLIMGRYEAEGWKKAGLLPAAGCPDEKVLFVWASPYQRTRETAKALADGAFPGCGVKIHSLNGDVDPLFHNDKMGLVPLDSEKARAGIEAAIGSSIDDAQRQAADQIAAMKAVVCLPDHPCPLVEQPWKIKKTSDGLFEVEGLTTLSDMAETFRLAWSNNNPLDQVAFGHVQSADDVVKLMPLLTKKYDYTKDVPYIAMRGGSVLMDQIARALDDGKPADGVNPPDARWLLYVAHDGNVAWLRTMLDFTWRLGNYPSGNIPPTGSLIFERWLDRDSGARFIRLYFQAQSLDQIRNLTALGKESAPLLKEYAMPDCRQTAVGTLCPYQTMLDHIRSHIDGSAIVDISYSDETAN